MERRYLEYQDGYSDKFYRILMTESDGSWMVTVWWGRRGTDGQTQVKYVGSSESAARQTLEKFYREKTAKGYVDALDPTKPALTKSSPAATPLQIKAGAPPYNASASTRVPLIPRFPAMKAQEIEDPWLRVNTLGDFVMEEKFDGFRAGLCIDGSGINIRNVYGEDKGRIQNTPHIERELMSMAAMWPDDLAFGTLIDGELVGLTLEETGHLLGASGRSDPRLRFMAFDLPFLAGKDLRTSPWDLRRNLLVSLLGDYTAGPISIVPVMEPRSELVDEIWARGGEGAIIKPIAAPYVGGARSYWIKIKEHHTADAVVTGYEMGNGKYANQVGAIILSQYRSGRLTEVCKASGMTDEIRRDMTDNWVNWLDYVVEFEYQKKTATSYRHPRFVRSRPDKDPRDCTWETSD